MDNKSCTQPIKYFFNLNYSLKSRNLSLNFGFSLLAGNCCAALLLFILKNITKKKNKKHSGLSATDREQSDVYY